MISKNQIKHIQSLHAKKNREAEGLFIIEGIKLVSEFISSSAFKIKEVFATTEYCKEYGNVLRDNGIQSLVTLRPESTSPSIVKVKGGGTKR